MHLGLLFHRLTTLIGGRLFSVNLDASNRLVKLLLGTFNTLVYQNYPISKPPNIPPMINDKLLSFGTDS